MNLFNLFAAVSVHVEWDADGHINNYRYGGTGYDLVPVEEPRILKPGEDIAVGCQVRVGKGRCVCQFECLNIAKKNLFINTFLHNLLLNLTGN